jgi:hypothetical protein
VLDALQIAAATTWQVGVLPMQVLASASNGR